MAFALKLMDALLNPKVSFKCLEYNKILLKSTLLFFLAQLAFVSESRSQINAYAEVTAVTGKSLAISAQNESFDAFTAGEQIVLMQMQDDVIGNTSNSTNFGDLGTIQSAGLYEVRVIDYVVRSGSLDSIVLTQAPTNTYNTGANESVQAISFPSLDDGGGDFTTTANITAVAWNGTIGGVAAFNVVGTLTLAHNITANTAGFRGAAANGGGSTGCTPTGSFRVTSQANFADKGEGIYKTTTANHAAGRAKILNGGGGGNSHNAGGAGGGNYTPGGDGGPGWVCSPVAGGIGGIDLSASISAARIFLGGGGGSGEGNNGVATGGGDGGGIIILKASILRTTGTCAGRIISANGESITANSGNDGSGGAGAGGSIVLQIDSFNVVAACDLTVEASGGDGGSVNSGAQHGGGGGGGQGVVIYSSVEPTTNVTTLANNGSGGCNNSSSPCTNPASPAGGTSGSGIIDNSTGPLPVTLVHFSANPIGDVVHLTWKTASELNNDFFNVQRSSNVETWIGIGKVKGNGNSQQLVNYEFTDTRPLTGTSYYRLAQVDFDGKRELFGPVAVNMSTTSDAALIKPSLVNSEFVINTSLLSEGSAEVLIMNTSGQEVFSKQIQVIPDVNEVVQLDGYFPAGVYIVLVKHGAGIESQKIYVWHSITK
ncbi:MAG: T9SS type A sorting domain-containing protein [Vicingaceae bacterium]